MQMLETLKKHNCWITLRNVSLSQSLVYLGYMICGRELKIDYVKIEAIIKWPMPINVTEVRSFVEAVWCLWKFVASSQTRISNFLVPFGLHFRWR
jgi:hypothetical protein